MQIDKRKLPVCIALCVIFVLTLSFLLLIKILSYNNTFLFLNGKIFFKNMVLPLSVLITSFCMMIFIIFKKKWIKISIFVLCVFILLFVKLFNGGFWESDKKYFTFSSPDNQKSIVIEECSWLLGGCSNCYIKSEKNSFFIKYIDCHIGTDDGYRPFSNNDYDMIWEDERVIVEYNNGNGYIEQVVIDLP